MVGFAARSVVFSGPTQVPAMQIPKESVLLKVITGGSVGSPGGIGGGGGGGGGEGGITKKAKHERGSSGAPGQLTTLASAHASQRDTPGGTRERPTPASRIKFAGVGRQAPPSVTFCGYTVALINGPA